MGQILSTGWTLEQSEALKDFVLSGLSYAKSAAAINDQFGTAYSRNAAIGRANRIGLAVPVKAKQPPRKRKPQPYKPRDKSRQKYSSVAKRFYEVLDNVEIEQLRCVEITPLNVSLVDLEPGDCRYPTSDAPFLFCGHPKQDGSSFCTPHHHLCWVPPRSNPTQARKYHGTDFARGAA